MSRTALFATFAILGTATAARADVEPPRPASRGPSDGVWAQVTIVQPVPRGSLALQYGELGANRIRYIAVQGERRLDERWGVGAAYAIGELRLWGLPDPTLHLFRLFANWTNAGRAVEVDARAWAEVLVAIPGRTTEQLRTRGRVSVALPQTLPLKPRLFVADELFFVRCRGFTRNRASVGLRTHPSPRLSLDLSYQRTDDTSGADQNIFLIQGTVVLGKRS